jgi:hypothetical protein
MEPEVEKLVVSARGTSSSEDCSSSCTESDSTTDVECFRSDKDDALHGIEEFE